MGLVVRTLSDGDTGVGRLRRRQPRIRVVGLDVQDRTGAAQEFVRAKKVGYPNVLDPDGTVLATIPGVPPKALPSTVVIDPQGRIAARAVGPVTRATLDQMLVDAGATVTTPRRVDSAPAGFEPARMAPEATALSPELRGLGTALRLPADPRPVLRCPAGSKQSGARCGCHGQCRNADHAGHQRHPLVRHHGDPSTHRGSSNS